MDSIKERKAAIRQEIKKRLSLLTNESKANKSNIISTIILESKEYTAVKSLLGYMASESEPDITKVLLDAMKRGKFVYIPRVKSAGVMDFFLLNNDIPLDKEVYTGKFGIREPIEGLKMLDITALPSSILMIAPGVAFDNLGVRLGHGAGYYDRYIARLLEKKKIEIWGATFCECVVDKIPKDNFDCTVDRLIKG